MKKILVLIVFLMMLSSVALASPLTDFSKGKTAIEITLYPSSDFKSSENTTNDMAWADAQNYMQFGITTGLGNNIAFQYNYSKMKTEDWSKKGNYAAGYDGVKNQEFNILYKVDKKFTVFTGLNQSQSVVDFSDNYNEFGKPKQFKGKTKNNWQFGVTGQTQIADNLTGFATAALKKTRGQGLCFNRGFFETSSLSPCVLNCGLLNHLLK